MPPAPALLANGWNDDLFPVDESVRYYNKVRAKYPNAPISMFHLDFGHNPRAGGVAAADAREADGRRERVARLLRQGRRAEPADARGGVDILTCKCPAQPVAGDALHRADWAQLAPGEIRLNGSATQTIVAPGTAPTNAFTSGDVCTTTSSADNASAATYKLDPAPASGVHARRLADDRRRVRHDRRQRHGRRAALRRRARRRNAAADRPRRAPAAGVGGGPTQQVFQLHPQAWNVAAGHVSSSSCSRRTRPTHA